jgi:hypothetical protein
VADRFTPLCSHIDYRLFDYQCTPYIGGHVALLANFYLLQVLLERISEICRNFVATNFVQFRRGFQSAALVLRVYNAKKVTVNVLFRALLGPSKILVTEFLVETTYILSKGWQFDAALQKPKIPSLTNVPLHFRKELEEALEAHVQGRL